MGKHRFGMPFEGPIIPFGSMVEYHPFFCQRLVATASVREESLTRNILRYVLYSGRIWKGDIMVADFEELEKMSASEIHARRLNAK